jgi:hypothetical protein
MARAGKHFFVLIFCYFLIKQKVVALAAMSGLTPIKAQPIGDRFVPQE